MGAITLMLATISHVSAAVVLSRSGLQTLLGGPGTIEDFESYVVGYGTNGSAGDTAFDSTSVLNGQGPGLVKPGLSFSGGAGTQWNGPGYFGSPSKEYLRYGDITIKPMVIDFSIVLTAFGLDLRAYSGFGTTAAMDIYATDDTTLIGSLTGISLSASGVPVFAGWENNTGIGKVVLSQTPWGSGWSPIIDNLEYGGTPVAAVPEMSSLFVWSLLVCAGAVATRRKLLLMRKQA